VPPIYQPEVAARGVLFAADHPRRRQYWVGASTVATIVANKLVPALLDRYLARAGYDSQQTSQNVDASRPDNLFQPVDGPDGRDHGAHGIFDARSHPYSAQLWLAQRPRLLAGLAAGTAAATGIVAGRRAGRQGKSRRPGPRSACSSQPAPVTEALCWSCRGR
jgi:hypothetical protein